eukprot:m.159317 g.159317  ORF g.159317 m.159317 type:complete len:228 (+) comp20901_c0_seq1:2019-2702(+)
MSRAHMLYGPEEDLKIIPQISLPSLPSLEPLKSKGKGLVVEGEIVGRTRVTVESGKPKARYMLLKVAVIQAFRRQYAADGQELEVVTKEMRKLRTGYLNSSYKDEEVRSDKVEVGTLHKLLDPVLQTLQPAYTVTPGAFDFWILEDALSGMDLVKGDQIRLKTAGDSPLIDSVSKLETSERKTVTNYTGGDQVGGSWTDKVLSSGKEKDQPLAQDKLEGVADDEWDD